MLVLAQWPEGCALSTLPAAKSLALPPQPRSGSVDSSSRVCACVRISVRARVCVRACVHARTRGSLWQPQGLRLSESIFQDPSQRLNSGSMPCLPSFLTRVFNAGHFTVCRALGFGGQAWYALRTMAGGASRGGLTSAIALQ